MPKTKSRRQKIKKKGKGLKDKKVTIRQLTQRNLPHEISDKIYTELSALTIQESFYKKYLKNLLNKYTIKHYEECKKAFRHFIEIVNIDEKTPKYLLNIKLKAETAIKDSDMLLDLKRQPELFKKISKTVDYKELAETSDNAIKNIRDTLLLLRDYNEKSRFSKHKTTY